jgi:hypothetical protein
VLRTIAKMLTRWKGSARVKQARADGRVHWSIGVGRGDNLPGSDGATHLLREPQVWKCHLGINPGGDQSLRRMLQRAGSPRHTSDGLGVEAVETFLADHVDRDPAFSGRA